ncbi:alpha/beta fold hydrolase [Catellatospora vulcania]|uniref:alpha/beta fold hydrolase n=1 Tax=Catellatospora vulcania TaxID=1460450 RepID=UPI0012D3C112|nr:alpha/beta hydrolase [Catellatospora vulcania]
MPLDEGPMPADTITSADGTPIAVHTTGTGPDVVILHDAAVPLQHYHALAEALEHRYTVHRYHRRGMPDAAAPDGSETVATDLADLSAVLRHTGARSVIGHGTGGFLALRAGLNHLPLHRIAVYDPSLSVLGRPASDHLDPLEQAVLAGDPARALTVLDRGTHPDGLAARLPFGLALLANRLLLRRPGRRATAGLLPAALPEMRRVRDHDGPPGDYAGITAEVLLAAGARSPEHFAENCRAVAEAIPGGQAVIIPGAAHDAPAVAHDELVRPLSRFLAGPAVTA